MPSRASDVAKLAPGLRCAMRAEGWRSSRGISTAQMRSPRYAESANLSHVIASFPPDEIIETIIHFGRNTVRLSMSMHIDIQLFGGGRKSGQHQVSLLAGAASQDILGGARGAIYSCSALKRLSQL